MSVANSQNVMKQEPIILAQASGDSKFRQAFISGRDVYSEIASRAFHKPYEDCLEFNPDGSSNKEGKNRRSAAKLILLGLMYGRGANSIAEQIGCSKEEAQGIIDSFYTEFKQVKKWQDGVIDFAKENGYVQTLWGRKRRLPDMELPEYGFESIGNSSSSFDPTDFDSEQEESGVDQKLLRKYMNKLKKTWKSSDKLKIVQDAREEGIKITLNGGKIEDARRQCVNSIIQGSAADCSKKAMIALHQDPRLKELDCHILIPIHDEVICECPIENAKECAERVASLMVQAAHEKIEVPIKCDTEITKVWYGEKLEV